MPRDLYFFKAKANGTKGRMVGITDDGVNPYSPPGRPARILKQVFQYARDRRGYIGSFEDFKRRFSIFVRGKRADRSFNVISKRSGKVVLIIEED